jgi:hypothetical protein
MRRLLIILIILIVPVVLITSCKKIPAGTSNTTPTASVSPSPSEETVTPSETDWDSGVKTDYSGLTEYRQPREIYTRLSDEPLMELQPSDDYGKLLPYIGETMYVGSYSAISVYGLMTEAGMIVTDPLYSYVYQGYYYSRDGVNKSLPAYDLELIPESVDEENPWTSIKHAACAIDGSWLTPFDYSYINFTDKVIIAMRDEKTGDADILDYNGNLLYNTTSLPCFSELPEWSGYSFYSGYGEGLFVLTLENSSIAIVDVMTGETVFMEYESGNAFSGGLAAVMKNGLYGFIDLSYAEVIPPTYTYADCFINGLNVVSLPDGTSAVIDRNGKQLLHNTDGISRWGPDSYCVYAGNNSTRFYDDALNEIKGPEGSTVSYIYNGWYNYTTSDGTVVMKDSEEHFLPGVSYVSAVYGGLVNYYESGEVWKAGVMSLDGEVVFPLSEDCSISFAESRKTGDIYFIASTYGDNPAYAVYNRNGSLLFSGNGYIVYYEEFELFQANDEMSFSYKDFSGNDIFRISLLQFVPD